MSTTEGTPTGVETQGTETTAGSNRTPQSSINAINNGGNIRN
jgi:hypothetical protein